MYKKFVTHRKGVEKDTEEYFVKEISSSDSVPEHYYLADSDFVIRVMGHLMGRVLQTIEASIEGERQCKAVKEIIRGHFGQEMSFVSEMMFDQAKLMEQAEEGMLVDLAKPVTIDQMLGLEDVELK